jgi:hypothetical protein
MYTDTCKVLGLGVAAAFSASPPLARPTSPVARGAIEIAMVSSTKMALLAAEMNLPFTVADRLSESVDEPKYTATRDPETKDADMVSKPI